MTSGSVWAENSQVHRIVSRRSQCWYPQSWLDDAITNGDASPYYGYARSVGFDPEWFSDTVPEVGGDSCVQHIYSGIGPCTDENRIGVRAIDALWDARLGTIGSFGDIGLHEYADRYCLEIITRDRWRDIVEASDYLPKPVRATYPRFRTLVGLDNNVWYDVATGSNRYTDGFDLQLPTAGVTYDLTVTIWLAEIRIDIDGDGTYEYTATCSTGDAATLTDCGGSLDNPIYTFDYPLRAFHPFTIETRWPAEPSTKTASPTSSTPTSSPSTTPSTGKP